MTTVLRGSRLQTFEATVLARRWLGEKVFELELSRPPALQFVPGQRVRFIHEKGDRDYSLVSSPEDDHILLLIKLVQGGAFSPVLARADLGTTFRFAGPMGYFIWVPSSRPAVFVATGTGIAPFVSMARSGAKGFILIHGVRKPDQLYYRSLLEQKASRYIACVSESRARGDPRAFHGRVTAYLAEKLTTAPYDFFLCGQGGMIRDAVLLVDRLFPGSLVYTETFYE